MKGKKMETKTVQLNDGYVIEEQRDDDGKLIEAKGHVSGVLQWEVDESGFRSAGGTISLDE